MQVLNYPKLSLSEAEAVVAQHYGIEARAQPLPSERDQNFKLVTSQGQGYVLKIANPAERWEMLDFENTVLDRLSRGPDAGIFPRVLPACDGQPLCQIAGPSGTTHWVRMVNLLPGRREPHAASPSCSNSAANTSAAI